MFRHLLDISVLNAYITYKAVGGAKSIIDFIITLSEELIVKYKTTLPIPPSRVGRSIAIVSKPSRLIGRHFPDYFPKTENRARPQRRCTQCQKEKKNEKLQVSGVLNAVLDFAFHPVFVCDTLNHK